MAGSDQMKPALYRAAMAGKYEDYYEALAADNGVGCRQVTAAGNTVLHVAALHGQKQFVEKILEKDDEDHVASSSMLLTRNKKDETVLHCAAEKGYADIVSLIISATKKYKDVELGEGGVREMIRMRDNVKDTALHKAVRIGHLEVVKLLVEEDPEFEYTPNDDGETPIYIAAELHFHDCLVEMLNKCKNPTCGGPLARNALHAAIITGLDYTTMCKKLKIRDLEYRTESSHKGITSEIQVSESECTILLLLENNIYLCEETDDFGWTPLHYAVKIKDHKAARMILERKTSAVYAVKIKDHKAARMILERKTSAAYIRAGSDDKEWTTTFHIAAKWGNIEMMEEISNRCPDCWEMVNSKGQNVLHEAILSKQFWMIERIESSDQFENLVHQKDEDGNTPLHLLAAYQWGCHFICRFMKERPMLNYFAFNKKHQTLFDIAVLENKDLFGDITIKEDDVRTFLHGKYFADRIDDEIVLHQKSWETKIEAVIEKGKTSIVVATLILTMTFAAGIAVPGGYHQEKGNPLLLQNAAFKAFIITNTFSFISSICSIAVHIAMVRQAQRYYPTPRRYETVEKLYTWQNLLLYLTYIGVVIAFLCGMYATLAPLRPLAIAVLILGFSIPLLTFIGYIMS